MSRLREWLASREWRWRPLQAGLPGAVRLSLRRRLAHFRELLDAETRFREIVTHLSGGGGRRETGHDVGEAAVVAADLTHRMVHDLCTLAGPDHAGLYETVAGIRAQIEGEIAGRPVATAEKLTYDLASCGEDVWGLCGGAGAHLGALRSLLRLPVADGFAITSFAYRRLLEENDLGAELDRLVARLVSGEGQAGAAAAIRKLMLNTDIPADLRRAVGREIARLEERYGSGLNFAMWASSVGVDAEDKGGEGCGWLEVPAEGILDAYRELLAMQLSEGSAGGACCAGGACAVLCVHLESVRARGLLYTVDPRAPEQRRMAVVCWLEREGSASAERRFTLTREPPHTMTPGGSSEGDAPVVDAATGARLAAMGLAVERYAQRPLEIMWSVGHEGELGLVRARVLGLPPPPDPARALSEASVRHPVLLRGAGVVVCRGVGCGRVVRVPPEGEIDPEAVPQGAVLCVRVASPALAVVMHRVAAIICDVGSPTGHLASLAREFRVPTVVDVGDTTAILAPGTEVTVDADDNVVYEGRVEALLDYRLAGSGGRMEPGEWRLLRRLLRIVGPSGPSTVDADPATCRTLDDVVNLVHDRALAAMRVDLARDCARAPGRRLESGLEVDLRVIDLGGGIDERLGEARELRPADLRCAPFGALWAGFAEGGSQREPRRRARRSREAARVSGRVLVTGEWCHLLLEDDRGDAAIDAYLSDEREANSLDVHLSGARAAEAAAVLARFGPGVRRAARQTVAHARRLPRGAAIDLLRALGRALGATLNVPAAEASA